MDINILWNTLQWRLLPHYFMCSWWKKLFEFCTQLMKTYGVRTPCNQVAINPAVYLLQINSPVNKVSSRLRVRLYVWTAALERCGLARQQRTFATEQLQHTHTHTHTHTHSTHALVYPAVLMSLTCSGICESHFSKPLDALGIVDGPILIQDSWQLQWRQPYTSLSYNYM